MLVSIYWIRCSFDTSDVSEWFPRLFFPLLDHTSRQLARYLFISCPQLLLTNSNRLDKCKALGRGTEPFRVIILTQIVRPVGVVGTADRRNSSLRNAPPGWDRPHFPHCVSKLIIRQVLRHLMASYCFGFPGDR